MAAKSEGVILGLHTFDSVNVQFSDCRELKIFVHPGDRTFVPQRLAHIHYPKSQLAKKN